MPKPIQNGITVQSLVKHLKDNISNEDLPINAAHQSNPISITGSGSGPADSWQRQQRIRFVLISLVFFCTVSWDLLLSKL